MSKVGKTLAYFITEDWVFISHRFALAKAAIDSGYRVILITNVSTYRSVIESSGIQVVALPFSRGSRGIFQSIKTVLQIISILRAESVSLLHNVAVKPVMLGSVAAWLARVPYVVNAITGRGSLFITDDHQLSWWRRSIKWGISTCLFLNPGAAIFQNPDDQDFFVSPTRQRHFSNRLFLIRGAGVSLDRFPYLPFPTLQQPITFVLMSRLIYHKGIVEFVEAAQSLRAKGYRFRAILVGEPDRQNPGALSESVLTRWHSDGVVEWVGFQADPVSVYQNAHVAVLPSYGEGLPKSLLEAAACGRPIITTDVPGCREVVVDQITGILVAPRSSDAISRAMGWMITHPAKLSQMGLAGRDRISTLFSEDIVVSETLGVYQSIFDGLSV